MCVKILGSYFLRLKKRNKKLCFNLNIRRRRGPGLMNREKVPGEDQIGF
jgi:hypothetical protein